MLCDRIEPPCLFACWHFKLHISKQSSNTKLGSSRAILSVNSAKISDRGARSLFKTARLPSLHFICRIVIMQICLPGRPPKNKGWGKTRVRGVIPPCQYLSTLGSYTQAFVNYFAQISSVFKNWITRVGLSHSNCTGCTAQKNKGKKTIAWEKKMTLNLISCFLNTNFSWIVATLTYLNWISELLHLN